MYSKYTHSTDNMRETWVTVLVLDSLVFELYTHSCASIVKGLFVKLFVHVLGLILFVHLLHYTLYDAFSVTFISLELVNTTAVCCSHAVEVNLIAYPCS